MTTAVEGGEWSAARPGRILPPGKARYPLYPLYRRLGGPQGRSGRAKNLAPPEFDPRTVQPVVSRYTYSAARLTSEDGSSRFFRSVGNKLPECIKTEPKTYKSSQFGQSRWMLYVLCIRWAERLNFFNPWT